jgi:hypothetical protein
MQERTVIPTRVCVAIRQPANLLSRGPFAVLLLVIVMLWIIVLETLLFVSVSIIVIFCFNFWRLLRAPSLFLFYFNF